MLPNPIFTLFGNGVYMYGICIAVGLISCISVFYLYTTKAKVPTKIQDFVFFVAIAAIAIGFLAAKLFQAFYDYIETGVFNFYNAGMTVMGGLVGGVIAFLAVYFGVGHFYFKGKDQGLHVKNFIEILRVAPMCILIAHGFGRIGCLMSGCCHGAYLGNEYVFGGIYMHTPDDGAGYFVPTQLYEALFLFALFAVLSIVYFKGCNITMPLYLAGYGVWRFIIEFFRTDERGAFTLGLSPSQWQSFLFLLAGGAIILFFVLRKIPLFEKRQIETVKESGNQPAEQTKDDTSNNDDI